MWGRNSVHVFTGIGTSVLPIIKKLISIYKQNNYRSESLSAHLFPPLTNWYPGWAA